VPLDASTRTLNVCRVPSQTGCEAVAGHPTLLRDVDARLEPGGAGRARDGEVDHFARDEKATGAYPHSGTGYSILGAYNSANGTESRTVSIP
jgi:hypothetical protein